MAGEKEADRVELALELFGRGPGVAPHLSAACSRSPNRAFCPACLFLGARLAIASIGSIAAKATARSGSSSSKAPARGEALERLLVDLARIDAAGDIGERGERPSAARLDDRPRLRFAHALDGAREHRRSPSRRRAGAHVEIDAREALTEGGATSMPSRCASARNSASLSVLPLSSVIEAARNSAG